MPGWVNCGPTTPTERKVEQPGAVGIFRGKPEKMWPIRTVAVALVGVRRSEDAEMASHRKGEKMRCLQVA